MSDQLLIRAKEHIVDAGGLLGGYSLRYYRWTDQDLSGSANVALFHSPGTSGPTDSVVQFPDISLLLLVGPAAVRQGDADMLAVLQYLRSSYKSASAFLFTPLGKFSGPSYLENGRAVFEMVIRCGVEDH